MNTDSLLWLLKPISILIEIASGAKSAYLPGGGYYFKQLNVVINKSCASYNFWLLCFLMLSGLALNFYHSIFKKTCVLVASLILSYLFTVLVNSCRIITSITVSNFNSNLLLDELMLHQAVGIVTNLSFLIIIYLITNHLLIKKHNAKFIESQMAVCNK